MERFKTCAFLNIIKNGVSPQRKDAIERMCKPYCKENCPINLPTLKFTGDSVVPYQESDEVDFSVIDKYIKTIYGKKREV